ncbi:MAG: hypothetical protein A2Z88_01830 [Omnitrophica WOR_2 bacterium GWA2_47_8]|nr:MAG: hypothetical protein A2Z88_01830 [Omnitrophica WOR_2 bacterium GWA2_47_8]
MINIKGDATLVGISELRTHSEEILAESKKHKVLIGKRNKPVAVLIDIDRYSKMEETLELLEDFALGFLAKEREEGSKDSNYIDIKEALRKVKKK